MTPQQHTQKTLYPQQQMIEKLRTICHADERLVAAMLYGSFAYGEGDEFSDLDVILYFADDALKDIDPRAWVAQIEPVAFFFVNEFGNRVAIFENLVRGEFHFDPAADLPKLASFRGNLWFPPSAILHDRTGALAQHLQALAEKPQRDTPATRQNLCDTFLNSFVFGMNVLARGEYARAVELMVWMNDTLLRMTRLDEKQTDHWHTPTRAVEHELSSAINARFVACTAPAEKNALWNAYRAIWEWGKAWISANAPQYHDLLATIDQRFRQLQPR